MLMESRVLSDRLGLLFAYWLGFEFIAHAFYGLRGSLVQCSPWSCQRYCMDRRRRRRCAVPSLDTRSVAASWLGLVRSYHRLHPVLPLHHQYLPLSQQNPGITSQRRCFPLASHSPRLPHLSRRHRSHGVYNPRCPLRRPSLLHSNHLSTLLLPLSPTPRHLLHNHRLSSLRLPTPGYSERLLLFRPSHLRLPR